jgi:hypothetical protein
MTRKDFELIADAILKSRKFATAEDHATIDFVVDLLADKIQVKHPKFDDYRFKIACGNIQREVVDGVTHIRTGKNRIFA